MVAVLFLDVLRDYLRGLESAPSVPVRAGRPAIDLPAARRHFLETAEAIETGERTTGARSSNERPVSSWDWLLHERRELDSFLLLVASELSAGQPAAEIQARHAWMLVVHEIRNALVPVQMALTGIYRALDVHAPGGGWQSQQERIDRGLDRVFRFVGELQKVALLITAPAEPFDIVAAIHDATTGLNGALTFDLRMPAAGVLPRPVGHRDRFTLAIVNILRNAVQNSTGPQTLVRLCAARAPGGRVVVTIEDDGPGVPEHYRERIFQQGFGLRQGGSGQGLAMVREVVESEMKGEVRCERGDLGGARFVLVLPAPAKESP